MSDQIDILAFGAHPDDVEIGMAGTLEKYRQKGYSTAICDLTLAERSSNGTVNIRQKEAALASSILGLTKRIQLTLPDRGLFLDDNFLKEIMTVIRKHQPKVVFAPYFDDRHPDHGNCARLVEEAVFSAGIKRMEDNENQPAHKVTNLYFYQINSLSKPDFYIDISNEIEVKAKALNTYTSQFEKTPDGVETPLTNGYVEAVISRERAYGKQIGSMYAEGFFAKGPLVLHYDLIGGI
ncbi:bacillithiol biosynthesis deacetylase BshB1 [Sutcliffiella rhizosphaerae]|uniref:N-acetyl-alpha-D-glucosaminyl L-malate deacetylase 1 n=1 Tax=Sutcliffiella rhizosphaerae TaxID=2880967 RepID=A0ABN8AIE5_9BACI|nr:bacillithiol biosynthesis deacetylase BshB1 [Sutcliffiella rhizosphaerae]CAG9622630.1 N-acetyl-alpha-D-glucosaminyl L-malate deacetylase 1 [Sutcliffiella rhizosphaerae]